MAVSLLPSTLRHPMAQGLLVALVTPLHRSMNRLCDIDRYFADTVALNSSNIQLERALNNLFLLDDRQIYIEYRIVKEDGQVKAWAFREERLDIPQRRMRFAEEESETGSHDKALYVTFDKEYPKEESFTVMIPSFLVHSMQPTDPTEKAHLQLITATIKKNKPTGRTYNLKIYDYE